MTMPRTVPFDAIPPPVEEVIFERRDAATEPDVVYLASPYSDPDPAVMEWRYRASIAAAAHLMSRGDVVFSPIAHSHEIGQRLGKTAGGNLDPNTHAFWMAQDLPMLRRATRLVVLMIPGWVTSRGVNEEIDEAVRLGLPIEYLTPWNLALLPMPLPLRRPDEPSELDRESAFEPTETQTFGPLDPVKDTNPKDGIGATKLPLSLVPPTSIAVASLAHLDGALKYGTWNWRIAGVRASIYLDAAARHLSKWAHGEDDDPDSGLPHLGHALACLNILVDAQAAGKLYDDRAPAVDLDALFANLTPHVERLKAKHAARSPRHYTIKDSQR